MFTRPYLYLFRATNGKCFSLTLHVERNVESWKTAWPSFASVHPVGTYTLVSSPHPSIRVQPSTDQDGLQRRCIAVQPSVYFGLHSSRSDDFRPHWLVVVGISLNPSASLVLRNWEAYCIPPHVNYLLLSTKHNGDIAHLWLPICGVDGTTSPKLVKNPKMDMNDCLHPSVHQTYLHSLEVFMQLLFSNLSDTSWWIVMLIIYLCIDLSKVSINIEVHICLYPDTSRYKNSSESIILYILILIDKCFGKELQSNDF